MSSSATSAADTESSSSLSRGEKRPLSPSDSPQSKKARTSTSGEQCTWDTTSVPTQNGDEKPLDVGLEHQKVQLPSIFTTFEDSFRGDLRRASAPSIFSERSSASVRHSPYPPTGGRANYTPINHSSLASYQFPPSSDTNSYSDSAYPNSLLSNGTTPSSAAFPSGTSSTFSSPLSSDFRPSTLSPNAYSDNEHWSTSPAGIVRPSSTPGQLSSPAVKYEEGLRHSSFSAPLSQSQMFAGSARISGQDRSRSFSAGVKNEWSFPSPDLILPSSVPTSLTTAPPSISVSSAPRSPRSVPSSQLVDRPQRKRGKLPKETTDFLKAWLHRHSDHPYPSEEEKKQLCNATGLSMSQVSNWMINVRWTGLSAISLVLTSVAVGPPQNSCPCTSSCIWADDNCPVPPFYSKRRFIGPHQSPRLDADGQPTAVPSTLSSIAT